MKRISHINRAVEQQIKHDLLQKMVLLAGPRQCGKSTLARKIAEKEASQTYNWDIESQRKAILKQDLNLSNDLWVFDELHKFRKWKNWLKGVYDEFHTEKKILVTGSARLDLFKKSGDSLQGRYFYHRLHPFTVAELGTHKPASSISELLLKLSSPLDEELPDAEQIDQLLHLGGFPEPLISGSELIAKRWRTAYGHRLVNEDLRQLNNVREFDRIELLYDRLPEVVSSSITIKRLAFDLEVSFESVASWIQMFENLYSCFRVAPFGLPRVQAVRKQQKMFLWDWSRIEDPGPRLENLVALHLLRLQHWAEDVWGEKLELRYYRDQQGHEVDFLILYKRQPLIAVEVKSSQQEVDSGLSYFLGKMKVPHVFQLHYKGHKEYQARSHSGAKVWMISVGRFLGCLI